MADIPINPVARRVQFTGNTGTGPFAFTFNIIEDADLAVYKGTIKLTITTDYTVSTNADGTGSVTLTTALVSSDVLTILGARLLERTTDFVAGGDFFAASVNEQMDSQVIMAQQLDEKLTRALKVNPGDEFTDLELPLKADRLNRVLQFNATTGDPEAGPTVDNVENAQTYANNASTSATNAANSASASASSASAAATSASNAASSETDAQTAQAAAETAKTGAETAQIAAEIAQAGAATSATNAAGSASSAATSAGSASSSASAAAFSASASASSASAASTAQAAAEAARDATLAAYDNFDDRYLGAKTSDPALDNDGNALVAGALYFNTTDEEMKLYTGSAWVAAYVSGAGYLAAANNLSDLASVSTARTNLGLGTAATTSSSDYATAAQGSLADSATQPGDNISTLTNDSGYLTGIAGQSIKNLSDVYSSMSPTDGQALIYDTTNGWQSETISAGAVDGIFWENDQTVTVDYTITNGKNAGSFGPITIASGVTVTVGAGETWTVV